MISWIVWIWDQYMQLHAKPKIKTAYLCLPCTATVSFVYKIHVLQLDSYHGICAQESFTSTLNGSHSRRYTALGVYETYGCLINVGKADWIGCCHVTVQGTTWIVQHYSLNLTFSFLNRISLLLISSTYSVVLTRLSGPRSRHKL